VALQNQNAQLEATVRDLEAELDETTARSVETDENTRVREQALQKAQTLIKKLNDECERTVKDLVTLEQSNEALKRQNRQL
jgi:hypothetical protein